MKNQQYKLGLVSVSFRHHTPEEILKAPKLDLIKYGLTEKQSHQILEINEQQLRTRSKQIKTRKS